MKLNKYAYYSPVSCNPGEAALESVRASSMAMHHSEELEKVVKILSDKLIDLGLSLDGALIFFFEKEKRNFHLWIATNQLPAPIKVDMPYDEDIQNNPIIRDLWRAIETGGDFINKSYSGKVKDDYFRFVVKNNESKVPEAVRKFELEAECWTVSLAAGKNSVVGIDSWYGKFITQQDFQVLKRFAIVFEQTYTRFLDLQKAEAQTREAKIEAALERVRTAAMAMHSSEGLMQVTQILREQVASLGEKELESILIHIYNEKADEFEAWYSYRHPDDPEGNIATGRTVLSWSTTARARLDKEKYYTDEPDYTIVADYAMLKEWYEHLFTVIPEVVEVNAEGKILVPDVLYYNYSKILGGALLLITNSEASQHSKDLLKRASKVFNLAYARFLDLKNAEAQARDSQIQLALERIRGRSLAMHHSNELKEVVNILFQQLKNLGLEFDGGAAIHLFIEHSKDAVILLASPELTSPIQVNLPFDEEAFENNPIILDVWHAKDTRENIFNRIYPFEEKNEYFKYVFKHNSLEVLPQSLRDFILQTDSYTASFIAEKNSLLGANSWSRQVFSEDDFDILKRIAKAFEQAYIRFLDLQKAEAQAIRAEQDLIEIKSARKKAEDTLTELRATQAQLIQKEKMASLGELTAGIAHEIQNPLNFVNNFSEVSIELIDELEEAVLKSEREEISSITSNIKENLQKVVFHGKRADAIVKGMLQHSRSSTDQKQLTDINALADEYLRLSYYGLRDKDFNADFKTDFDESISKIEVVPQDIGRVLLNLYNNAFYAVNEKKKTASPPSKGGIEYEPTVTVTTSFNPPSGDKGAGILISVKDNGNGIPQKVLDKIFQPFFTTKPTGQGTGLGLSLSYDIVKAHGGELYVETKELEGTTFIISIPVK